MSFTTLVVAGADATRILNEHRLRFPALGVYPFLIGEFDDVERLSEASEFNTEDVASIIRASLDTNTAEWIEARRADAEEYDFSSDEVLGEWPGEVPVKGSIGLHKDMVSGRIKPEAYLGLATIEVPWHLPAFVKFGGWNDCPEPAIHCAFHREWQETFGAEITGISADIVECTVSRPPTDQHAATELAWAQYWYCKDIVEQGCGSVSYLAATLINSPYWYFWWD